jgi:hypothetical protein
MPPKRKKKKKPADGGRHTKRPSIGRPVLPLWTNPTNIQPADTDDELKNRADKAIRTFRFQSAMLNSDFEAAVALADEFQYDMDNSKSFIVGRPNPVKLWSGMKTVKSDDAERQKYQDLLDRLIQTGAGRFINEPDAQYQMRPVDIAMPAQRGVLVHQAERYGVDLNPTAKSSPLYSYIDWNALPSFGAAVIRRTDPQFLDWLHPTSQQTPFHLALSKTSSRGVAELFVPYAAIGLIDPYHACFNDKPIGNRLAKSVLALARLLYDQYAAVQLPNQVAAAVPFMLPQLVDLVRDYAAYVDPASLVFRK